MIVGIHHVAIGVPDFDKGLAFYRDTLGLEVVESSQFDGKREMVDRAIGLPRVTARMAMLKAPNAYIELWQYTHPAPEDRRGRPCDTGYVHFCLQVDGIKAEYQRLVAAGMEFAGEPVDFGPASAIYGKDPFGNVIELYEIRDEAIAQLDRGE
ncbi:MAG: glyoxalase/bleomycin resistance/dioxygenase family protein [Gammaproteobacteria bacterium]|nr:glyoxalase/bleomycin resistance/dioxygenase family protein [Gammaproteobacteria bacterium]